MTLDPIAWGKEKVQGFHALFNGRNMEGWREINSTHGQWTVQDGALRYKGKGSEWLRTETTHDNFVLRLQWRYLQSRGNAGLFLRTGNDPASPGNGVRIGMQDSPFSAGALGTAVPGAKPTGGTLKPSPQWNDLEIAANEQQVIIKLNGKEVSRTTTAPSNFGYIGLKGGGTPFELRNVRINEPGWTPLLNGKNLPNWRTASAGHWSLDPNGILVSDGEGGDLNTSDNFGDYDLRLDWRLSDAKSVGGVYYRGSGFKKAEAAIWSNPVGSGANPAYRADTTQPEAVRKAATPLKRADGRLGEWNHFDIRVRGRTVNLWLNGERVLQNSALPGMPLHGPIGLQNPGYQAWFRNIEVRQAGTSKAAPATQKPPLTRKGVPIIGRQNPR
jgi:hypothetical protein